MNRLLVVDDEMNIRKVIREYAEFNDFLVDEAADGEQAVEILKQTLGEQLQVIRCGSRII